MLKPVTKEERLLYTLQFQTEKAYDELLGELVYNEKYEGYVDLWFEIRTRKDKLITEVKSKKILIASSPLAHPDADRFQILPEKGARRIPVSR